MQTFSWLHSRTLHIVETPQQHIPTSILYHVLHFILACFYSNRRVLLTENCRFCFTYHRKLLKANLFTVYFVCLIITRTNQSGEYKHSRQGFIAMSTYIFLQLLQYYIAEIQILNVTGTFHFPNHTQTKLRTPVHHPSWKHYISTVTTIHTAFSAICIARGKL